MKIEKRILAELINHARKEAPLEACGYLAAKDGIVSAFYELTNIDHSSEHFSFDPKEQFAVMKDVRAKGFEICAVYHSHPASPARPSPEDIKLAYDSNMLYVILSLADGKEDIKAFRIRNQEVEAVSLEVIYDGGYNLPPELDCEISQLEELIDKFKRGEISSTELKAHRVPFGVYEQREPATYMMRIRCAAGAISPFQLEKVARIASSHGLKDLHITTRQELQIHYVKLDDIIPIIRALKEVGLGTRGGGGNTVRNIVAAPDAGIDPEEVFDVSPYAVALTSRLIAEGDSWNLPRKFKIAFSGSEKDKGYATFADVGFVAKMREGKKGFRVYAAGGLGAKSEIGKLLLDFVNADEVYPAAKALKTIFSKYGNRKNKHAARLRFLWRSLGEEEFKKRFHEEYSKIKGEGFLPLAVEDREQKVIISGLASEDPRDPETFALWTKRFVLPQKQEGLFSVLVPVALGFMACEDAIRLALFLKSFQGDALRMTKDQNFLLRNVPHQHLGNIYNFLSEGWPDFNRPAIHGRILSCAGASTCQLGICLSRQAARALMNLLGKSGLDLDKAGDIKLNISGCPNSCGQHPVADVGFFGKALRKEGYLYPAYNVLAGGVIRDGGTKFAEQVGEVPAKNLPALVENLLAEYLSKVSRYKNFQEYIVQDGKEDLKKLCVRYKEIPSFKEDKNYFFDWGADTLFSLADRGAGECSAGLFDLIERDLNLIRKTQEKLAAGENKAQKAAFLVELIFYSTRMLLITRGVEPKNEQEACDAFLRHFIETGLVSQSFQSLLTLMQHKDYPALIDKENEVLELAETVVLLYESMDNSFNFKNSPPLNERKEKSAASQKVGGAKAVSITSKDFRGVVCPLNFVKTKVELSKLGPGDLLEIWLDDGAPIENVPGSVKAEGHKIISQKKIYDYWVVVIEKKAA